MYLNLAGAQEAGGLPRHALSSTAQTTVLSALFHSHNFSLNLPGGARIRLASVYIYAAVANVRHCLVSVTFTMPRQMPPRRKKLESLTVRSRRVWRGGGE